MLSKEKQGRPGIQNGRSRPIDLYYDDKLIQSFDYITLCIPGLPCFSLDNILSFSYL